MTHDTRTTRPGALALECLEALDRGAYELANTRESAAALSDLRALIARCEAAERAAESALHLLREVKRPSIAVCAAINHLAAVPEGGAK